MNTEHIPPLPTMPTSSVASIFTFKVVAVLHVLCVAVFCLALVSAYHGLSRLDRAYELAARV